jgi:hypothetical protein
MPGHVGQAKFTAGRTVTVTIRLQCVPFQPVTRCRRSEWDEPSRCLNSFENIFVLSNHRYKACRLKARDHVHHLCQSSMFFHMSLSIRVLFRNTANDHPVRNFGLTGFRTRVERRVSQGGDAPRSTRPSCPSAYFRRPVSRTLASHHSHRFIGRFPCYVLPLVTRPRRATHAGGRDKRQRSMARRSYPTRLS